MKLYTRPGACSTADHIVLHWSGLQFEVGVLDAESSKDPSYRALNPTGAVPTLVDGDFVLTQNAAILGYIADHAPGALLFGDGSPRQRAEATRWLAFANSDLHPAFKPLFAPGRYIEDAAQHEAVKQAARRQARGLFEMADRQLAGREWIAGFRSVADAYLYVILGWAARTGVDLDGLEHLAAFRARMDADGGVVAARRAEGLA